jgi:hypothetical protein
VSFAEKRTCTGSTATNPAGWYVLTVGATSYLVAFDSTNTFQVVGFPSGTGATACDQYRAALSVGDVIVFTAGTGVAKVHNMTSNSP